jgi:hypothetical protein
MFPTNPSILLALELFYSLQLAVIYVL